MKASSVAPSKLECGGKACEHRLAKSCTFKIDPDQRHIDIASACALVAVLPGDAQRLCDVLNL